MTPSENQRPVRPVHQERSRKTLKALLDALDRLLRDRPFESITVLELSQAAGVSTGAFYARFASKEDLLPELYARFQDSLEETTDRELDPSNWAALSIDERLERISQFLCDTYENRSWLLRAIAIHSRRRQTTGADGDGATTAQEKWLQKLADCVSIAPFPNDIPRDRIEFALYTAITVTREAILFPHLPMATALGLSSETMRHRLPELIRRQLGLPAERN